MQLTKIGKKSYYGLFDLREVYLDKVGSRWHLVIHGFGARVINETTKTKKKAHKIIRDFIKIAVILVLTSCQTTYYFATQPGGYVIVGEKIKWKDTCYVGDFDTIPDLYNQYRGKSGTFLIAQ